jgi:hypothetical protein
MLILRRTGSTILKLGKKNEDFRNDLLNLNSIKPIQSKDNLPEDILRLFNVERKYDAKLNHISYWTKKGVQAWVYSEEKILDQINSGKTPMGRKRIDEDRVILAYTTGTEYFAIGWYMDDYCYKVSKETAPHALITRSVKNLFGRKNFEVYYKTNFLQDAFKWIDNNALPTTTIIG